MKSYPLTMLLALQRVVGEIVETQIVEYFTVKL